MTPALAEERGVLNILDHTGDTEIAWNPRDRDETDNAREQFNKFKAKGYLAYSVDKAGEKDTVIKEFDASARRIILSKPNVGG